MEHSIGTFDENDLSPTLRRRSHRIGLPIRMRGVARRARPVARPHARLERPPVGPPLGGALGCHLARDDGVELNDALAVLDDEEGLGAAAGLHDRRAWLELHLLRLWPNTVMALYRLWPRRRPRSCGAQGR